MSELLSLRCNSKNTDTTARPLQTILTSMMCIKWSQQTAVTAVCHYNVAYMNVWVYSGILKSVGA